MSLINKIAVYPTILYSMFYEYLGLRKWYTRIDEHCILGAIPMRRNFQQIIEQEKVKAVLTLNEDHELDYSVSKLDWERANIELKQVPVVDYVGVANMEQINASVEFIMKHRALNQTVYVHCKAGRYRSALIVTCYLIKSHKMTPSTAAAFIKKLRPHVMLDKKRQLNAMHEYYKNLYP